MNIEFGNGKHMLYRYLIPEDFKESQGYHHPDPMFDELTYGDYGRCGNMIRNNVKPGSHIFFHATIKTDKHKYITEEKQRCVTAHYYVKKVIEGYKARRDENILKNYKNPHVHPEKYFSEKCSDDILIIADPDREKSLGEVANPLVFDRHFAEKITFEGNRIKFDIIDKNGNVLTDSECIRSCCKTPRYITKSDVRFLFDKMVAENP